MESSKPQHISPSIAGGAQLIESLIDHAVARAVEKERVKHETLKSEIDEKWRPTCEQLEKQLLLENDENEKLAAKVAELEARLETQKSSKDECTCRSKVTCNMIPMPTPMSPPSSTLVDITMDDITLIPEESMCVDAYLTQCDSEEAASSTLTPVPIPNHTLSIGHMINGESKPDIDSMTQSHFAFQDQIHKGAAEDIHVDDSKDEYGSSDTEDHDFRFSSVPKSECTTFPEFDMFGADDVDRRTLRKPLPEKFEVPERFSVPPLKVTAYGPSAEPEMCIVKQKNGRYVAQVKPCPLPFQQYGHGI